MGQLLELADGKSAKWVGALNLTEIGSELEVPEMGRQGTSITEISNRWLTTRQPYYILDNIPF